MPAYVESWVVYVMTLHNNEGFRNAVCNRREWDALEVARPGRHKLVQDGFGSEAEAERQARGTLGDA